MSRHGDHKWTSGPWGIAEANLRGMFLNDGSMSIMGDINGDRRRIATVDPQAEFKRGQGHNLTDDPERDANAYLSAASPALYEALEELCDAIKDGLCNSGTPAFGGPERLHNAIEAADAALSQALPPKGDEL